MDAMDLPLGVERILAPNPSLLTGPGTNTFIVANRGEAVVIDPGPDITEHLERIAAALKPAGRALAILVTHGHPDHMEGAAHLRALTGAPILAWSREGVPDAGWELRDGERIAIGGRALRTLYTPGHRFDHVCFLLEDAAALFAGDLVAGEGTVVIAPPEGDLAQYLDSLRRLLALDPRLMLPAHGPTIDRPRELLAYYIAHREQREAQVLAALAGGPRTVAELVAAIYADVNPELHPIAAYSVLAHLTKLEREGRVQHDTDDRWEVLPTGVPGQGK